MGAGGGTFYKRGKKGAYITWDARKETAAKTTKQESRHPTPHVPNAKASSYVRAPQFSPSEIFKLGCDQVEPVMIQQLKSPITV